MLRDLAPADIPQLLPLLERHFPEEGALLGWRPESFNRVVRRLYRWDYRLLLGLMRLIGRPVYRCFVVDVDGRVAGITLLTFGARAGYVSSVVVDEPFRRRGYAKTLLSAASEATRRSRRSSVVLDVLEQNLPAKALYASLGYRRLRGQGFFRLDPLADPPSPAAPPGGVRPFRPADAEGLAEIQRAGTPPEVEEVLPSEASAFRVSRALTGAFESTSEAWVAPAEGRPRAFIRATSSGVTEAGHLAGPVIEAGVDDPAVDALLETALAWLRAHGHRRAVAEVAEYDPRGRSALERAGFKEAQRMETLVRSL